MGKRFRASSGRYYKSKGSYERSRRAMFRNMPKRIRDKKPTRKVVKTTPKRKAMPRIQAKSRTKGTKIEATNTPDGTIVTVGSEQEDKTVQIIDQNPTPLKSVVVEEIGGMVIIEGETVKGEKTITVVSETPSVASEAKKL